MIRDFNADNRRYQNDLRRLWNFARSALGCFARPARGVGFLVIGDSDFVAPKPRKESKPAGSV